MPGGPLPCRRCRSGRRRAPAIWTSRCLRPLRGASLIPLAGSCAIPLRVRPDHQRHRFAEPHRHARIRRPRRRRWTCNCTPTPPGGAGWFCASSTATGRKRHVCAALSLQAGEQRTVQQMLPVDSGVLRQGGCLGWNGRMKPPPPTAGTKTVSRLRSWQDVRYSHVETGVLAGTRPRYASASFPLRWRLACGSATCRAPATALQRR